MTPDVPIPVLRWCANLLALWGLCARPACRHAQACRCDPRDCLSRYAPLVPDDAREGAKAMAWGRDQGLDFDAMCAQAPLEVAAMIAWMERVARSARMPSAAAAANKRAPLR